MNDTDQTVKASSSAIETRDQLASRKEQLLEEILNAVIDEGQARTRLDQAVSDLRVLKLATWDEIGKAIGITGQAAYNRYGKRLI